MRTRSPGLIAVAVAFIVIALIVFVLASAAVGVPSEVSLPVLVLAALAFRSLRSGTRRQVITPTK